MNTTRNDNVPVRDTMLPYGKQWIDEDDITEVVKVLRGDFVTQGPYIQTFEQKVASYVGSKYAVAFCNGTAALHAACFAAGIGLGDEVITSPLTFLASSNCILYQGGVPVFADIKLDTYNIDPDNVTQCITSRTKAIIAVDFTGQPAEMDRIQSIAKEYGLITIQDGAHSLGASYNDNKVGSLADMTMFSFHPVKHITTGEGGIIVTDNEIFYNKLQRFRNHGMTRNPEEMKNNDGPWYYEMHDLGFNYRMTDIQAALGVSQIRKIDKFLKRRREIVDMYNDAFSLMKGMVLPYQHEFAKSSWHLYITRWLPEYFTKDRNEIFKALRSENIGVNVHYIPVYLQPYYQRLGYKSGLCQNAESVYQTSVTLPLFPRMTDEDVHDVIRAVKKVYSNHVLRGIQ